MLSPKGDVFVLTLVAVVSFAIFSERPSHAASARSIKERETEARAEYMAGQYEAAVESFSKLFAETSDPVYLRNLARGYQMLKRPKEAIPRFEQYLSTLTKPSDAKERQEIEGYIQEMNALLAEQAPTEPGPTVPSTTGGSDGTNGNLQAKRATDDK